MYYMFSFKSGFKKKILGHKSPLDLLNEIERLQKEGKQFIMLNAEIIRLDAIEHIEGLG